MNINTSRLGIFELIGYLFSGVYVSTAIVLPFYTVGLFPLELESLGAMSLTAGFALLVICYALGIFASRFAMNYYDGSQQLSIDCPPMHPFRDELGPEGNDTDVIWKWVDAKIMSLVPTLSDSTPSSLLDNKSRGETLYHGFGYASPLLGSIDRIASVVRFCSAIVVGAILHAVVWVLVAGYGLFLFIQEQAAFNATNWIVSLAVAVVAAALCYSAHALSKQYADSYWAMVATGILTIPMSSKHERKDESSSGGTTPSPQASAEHGEPSAKQGAPTDQA